MGGISVYTFIALSASSRCCTSSSMRVLCCSNAIRLCAHQVTTPCKCKPALHGALPPH